MSPFNVLKWLMVLRGIANVRKRHGRGLALEAKRRAMADLLDYAGLTAVDADLRARQQQAGEMNTLRYQIEEKHTRLVDEMYSKPFGMLDVARAPYPQPRAFDMLRHQIKQNRV